MKPVDFLFFALVFIINHSVSGSAAQIFSFQCESCYLGEFKKFVRLSLDVERSEFQTWDPHIMTMASNLSLFDHFKIFKTSIGVYSGAHSKYLLGYLNYIMDHRIPPYLDEYPEEEHDLKTQLLDILHRLVKFNYPTSILEPILMQTFSTLTYNEQIDLYCLAYRNYHTLPIENSLITTLNVFNLLALYLPDPLLCPINNFTRIEESFTPSLNEIILHFGPLLVILASKDPFEEYLDDILDQLYLDLFIIDSKPIHLSDNLLLFFNAYAQVIHEDSSIYFNDILMRFLYDSLSITDDIPSEILTCCKRDFPLFLSYLLKIYENKSFSLSQITYLFVQSKRSLDQRIHQTLLHNFSVDLVKYDTVIAPVLKACSFTDSAMQNIRNMVIKSNQ